MSIHIHGRMVTPFSQPATAFSVIFKAKNTVNSSDGQVLWDMEAQQKVGDDGTFNLEVVEGVYDVYFWSYDYGTRLYAEDLYIAPQDDGKDLYDCMMQKSVVPNGEERDSYTFSEKNKTITVFETKDAMYSFASAEHMVDNQLAVLLDLYTNPTSYTWFYWYGAQWREMHSKDRSLAITGISRDGDYLIVTYENGKTARVKGFNGTELSKQIEDLNIGALRADLVSNKQALADLKGVYTYYGAQHPVFPAEGVHSYFVTINGQHHSRDLTFHLPSSPPLGALLYLTNDTNKNIEIDDSNVSEIFYPKCFGLLVYTSNGWAVSYIASLQETNADLYKDVKALKQNNVSAVAYLGRFHERHLPITESKVIPEAVVYNSAVQKTHEGFKFNRSGVYLIGLYLSAPAKHLQDSKELTIEFRAQDVIQDFNGEEVTQSVEVGDTHLDFTFFRVVEIQEDTVYNFWMKSSDVVLKLGYKDMFLFQELEDESAISPALVQFELLTKKRICADRMRINGTVMSFPFMFYGDDIPAREQQAGFEASDNLLDFHSDFKTPYLTTKKGMTLEFANTVNHTLFFSMGGILSGKKLQLLIGKFVTLFAGVPEATDNFHLQWIGYKGEEIPAQVIKEMPAEGSSDLPLAEGCTSIASKPIQGDTSLRIQVPSGYDALFCLLVTDRAEFPSHIKINHMEVSTSATVDHYYLEVEDLLKS